MWPCMCVSVSGPLTGGVVYNVSTRVVLAFRPSCKEPIVTYITYMLLCIGAVLNIMMS